MLFLGVMLNVVLPSVIKLNVVPPIFLPVLLWELWGTGTKLCACTLDVLYKANLATKFTKKTVILLSKK